jgi:hypothetical protein
MHGGAGDYPKGVGGGEFRSAVYCALHGWYSWCAAVHARTRAYAHRYQQVWLVLLWSVPVCSGGHVFMFVVVVVLLC